MTELMLKATNMGAEWVLWLLIVLSLVSFALIFERIVFFASRKVDVDDLSARLSSALQQGDVDAAKRVVADSNAIECKVIAAGLDVLPRGLHSVTETMQSTKARERLRLEAFLPVLGTLGNNAPFIGLLGTVIGIIRASQDMAAAQAAKQSATSAVMSGVFEALVATAVGLFVALPAVVAFNIFQRRARNSLLQVDSLAHLLISFIKPKTGQESSSMGPPPGVAKAPLPPSAKVPQGQGV